MMGYNMANILILFAIISVAAVSDSTGEVKSGVLDSLGGNVCPPFGKKAKFEVETIQTKSLMYGCAYSGNQSLSTAPFFHLWLESSEHTGPHAHCDNTKNMDHFIFECLSKHNRQVNRDESEMGWHYISLMEHTEDSMKSKTKTRSYRCALYDVEDEDGRMIRIIRMVISKPIRREEFDVRQCDGLSEIMGRDLLPIVPEGFRYWPDGSLYIYLLGRKAKSFYTTTKSPEDVQFPVTSRPTTTTSRPSTTTTTSRPSTTTTTSRPSTTTTTTTTTTTSPTTTTTTTTTESYRYSIDDFFRDLILFNNNY